MGDFLVQALAVRVAGEPTYYPSANPDNQHAQVTVIANRTTRNNKEVTDEVTANFWGKNAAIAANFLYPGKQLIIRGRLVSFRKPTGRIKSNGKEEINRVVEIAVGRATLLADSRKYQEAQLQKSLASLKAAGRLPQSVNLTLDEIFPKKMGMVEFNPNTAAQTGKFGYAKVWSKDRGFWGGNAAPAQTTAPAENAAYSPEQIQAQINALQAQLANAGGAGNAANAAGTGVEDPFPM